MAAAVAEDVHCVGLSILSGSHMELVPDVLDGLREAGLADVPVIVGGIIPDSDARRLRELGVGGLGQRVEQREVGQRREQAAAHDDGLAADLVGQPAEEDEERRAEQQRDRDQRVRGLAVDLEVPVHRRDPHAGQERRDHEVDELAGDGGPVDGGIGREPGGHQLVGVVLTFYMLFYFLNG